MYTWSSHTETKPMGICKPVYLVPVPIQARINWEGMAEMGTPISPDGVAVHPDCWCVCLHFAPEKIQKMAQYTLWYQLTRVVADKVHRVVKWLCVCYSHTD